jgi:hypothetical protein
MTHAGLRSGIAPRLGMRMVGHQVTRVSRHVGAVRVADQGRHPGHSAIDQQVGSRQLTTVGCHPAPACKIRARCGEAGRETADQELDARQADTSGQSPQMTSPLAYISWYINDYGRP